MSAFCCDHDCHELTCSAENNRAWHGDMLKVFKPKSAYRNRTAIRTEICIVLKESQYTWPEILDWSVDRV